MSNKQDLPNPEEFNTANDQCCGGECKKENLDESEEKVSEEIDNEEENTESEEEITVEKILAAAEEDQLLTDLKRVTAEYANYRKRTEANKEIEKQRITAQVVSSLIPLLDDLDLAEMHGDLAEGGAAYTMAQKARGALQKLGLESFGEVNEVFDPNQHEAITQLPSENVEVETVIEVFAKGYRIGQVQIRAAKVVVAVPKNG